VVQVHRFSACSYRVEQFLPVAVLTCHSFCLSPFWSEQSVAVLVSPFWRVAVLVCRRFMLGKIVCTWRKAGKTTFYTFLRIVRYLLPVIIIMIIIPMTMFIVLSS